MSAKDFRGSSGAAARLAGFARQRRVRCRAMSAPLRRPRSFEENAQTSRWHARCSSRRDGMPHRPTRKSGRSAAAWWMTCWRELRERAAERRTIAREVKLIETHISWVLLGPEVYKIKKPVTLPFLDFASFEAREQCVSERGANQPAPRASDLSRRRPDPAAARTGAYTLRAGGGGDRRVGRPDDAPRR